MANNRLYMCDVNSGAQLLLAKGWGEKWEVHADADAIEDFLNEHFADQSDMRGTADNLVLRTEYDLA